VLSEIVIRLRALILRRQADEDLDEELRYHLDREIERNVANGMTAAAARDAARRAFGNVTVATENARDSMRWAWLEELRQDARFTYRTCRRSPTFVLTVVATIGLGLGLLTTAFTVFNAYVLRPLAVRDADRLYEVLARADDQANRSFSWERVQALRARRDLVDDAFAFTFHSTRIRGSSALGQLVSANYFDMLSVPPALGRTFVPDDATPPRGADVVVLSHRLWTSTFGGDSSIIGQRISLRGVPVTVIGVAREGFGGLGSVPNDFWAPLTLSARLGASDPFGMHPADDLRLVIRTRGDASAEQTTGSLRAWLREATSDGAAEDRIGGVFLMARGTSIPAVAETYQLFAPIAAAFVLVLVIACANVANMMLARGFARQREIGIRLALGAGRARLIRQLLTEAALLSIPAAVFGFIISRLAIDLSVRVMFSTVPAAYTEHLRVVPFSADARLVIFMFVAAAMAAMAFGLVPALQATRPNIVRASRGDFDTELRPSRLRHGLVAMQVAFSVILLICAGVLLRNAHQTQRFDPGIQGQRVLQLGVTDRSRATVLDLLRGDTRVDSVASAFTAPLDGGWWVIPIRNAAGTSEASNVNFVSPQYFGVLGLPLMSGRTFTNDEALGRAPVVVVSEAAAKRYWPGTDPIGQTLQFTPPRTDTAIFGAFRNATVIGVVRNTIPGSIARASTWPAVYYPLRLDARGAPLLIKTRGDADALQAGIVSTVTAMDSSAVIESHSVATSLALQLYPFHAAYWLATAVGIVALLLTITGVYGVVSYLVWQRRKEFGIRMALGAAASSVVALVLRQSLRSCVTGVAIGVFVALGMSKLLAGSLVVANSFDPIGYFVGVVAVVSACAAASYVPSRRAAAIDPVSTLRADS
jgi:predicted permease